jgi:hypothetical protein
MNYLQARRLASGPLKGKWHFTVRNDDQIWPIGYCRHECPGHDTSVEAEKHYYDYQIDTAVFRRFTLDERLKEECEFPECNNFTQMVAQLGGGFEGRHITLCNRHQNRAGLKIAVPFQAHFQIISS